MSFKSAPHFKNVLSTMILVYDFFLHLRNHKPKTSCMKKFYGLLIALSLCTVSFASPNVLTPKKPAKLDANAIMLPIGKDGQSVSLMDLSRMKVKELEAITGEKMKLIDKIGFIVAQKQLRNSINADGTISSKKLEKVAAKAKADGDSGFHLGGFALGFLLGLIGVLIAYLIKDDKKKNRVKWAWLGLLASVVLWLIVVVI